MGAQPYREPTEVPEPAPYWNPMENCPLGCCPGNWGFLYPHNDDCEWQKAYVAAGRRMKRPTGTACIGGQIAMTHAEVAAIQALRPLPPPKPSLLQRVVQTMLSRA